jgi:hypothetical protein
MTMQAEYTISEDDYVKAQLLAARRGRRRWFTIGGGMVAGFALAMYGPPAMRDLSLMLVSLAIGFAVVIVITRVGIPYYVRRHYRQYKLLHAPFTLHLRDSGLHFVSPETSLVLDWDKIVKWQENDDFVLVYSAPRLFYIIPKRIQAEGFDVAQLTGQLTSHVTKRG